MVSAGASFPETPAYGGSVFISYARADDEAPPFETAVQGWVTFFWHQLRFELTNAGVHQAKLWLDRYAIEPAEDFTDKIDEALRHASLIVPILSPNWVQRPWCRKEIARFCELHGPDGKDRIVLVVKREPPAEHVPEPLRNRLGYRFFAEDPTGTVREFYWRGLQDRQAYLDIVRDMADRIAKRLLDAPAKPAVDASPRTGRTVYVAASPDELRDARQRLVNDLRHAGYAVLPEEDRLPDTLSRAEEAVRGMLASAETSVHLFGAGEGAKPDGGDESVTRLQLRLARERAAASPQGFPRILWAPKWLPSDPDLKRDPFDVVKRFGGSNPGEEVYGEEVTNLSQWLRGRLAGPPQGAASTGAPSLLLVAGAAAADDDLVGTLANRLQGSVARVQPLFFGDPPPSADPAAAIVLVPWGEADRAGLDGLLAALAPLSARIVVLRLPGGDEVAKRRFFADNVYAEKLDALPADRSAARALLARLELVETKGAP